MRKLLSALMLTFFMAASCHAKALNITVTIFPVYDWVREIIKGTDSDIKLLLDNGVDLHSYNPSVDDIVRISTCDVFIYTGGESDEWVKNALRNVTNRNQIVINLLDVLGDAVKEEEMTEGMQHEHHHEHEHEQLEHGHEEEHHGQQEHHHEHEHHEQHERVQQEQHKQEYEQPKPKPQYEHNEHGYKQQEHHHEHVQHEQEQREHEYEHGHEHGHNEHEHEQHGHEHESESDEHVWLSLRNAKIICRYISDKLSEIDG